MRTAIKAGWVVGYDNGGHTLIRHGVVVYEDNRILSVGASFDGSVDREIDASDKLVAPGFIDTHIHYGIGLRIASLPTPAGRCSMANRSLKSRPQERQKGQW